MRYRTGSIQALGEMEELPDLSKLPVPQRLKKNELFLLPCLQRTIKDAVIEQVPIFVRSEVAQLYREMLKFFKAKNDSVQFRLTGPPGSGKTAFITLFCRMVAVKLSQRVLFVSYRSQLLCDVQIFDKDKVYWLTGGSDRKELSAKVKETIATEQPFRLCVLDGLRDSLKEPFCQDLLQIVNGRAGTGQFARIQQTILATSQSFRFRDQDSLEGIVRASLDSWDRASHELCFDTMLAKNMFPRLLQRDILRYIEERTEEDSGETEDADMSDADLEDLVDDNGDETLRSSKEKDSLSEEKEPSVETNRINGEWLSEYVDSKYFYAGGCARFMYAWSMPDLVSELIELTEAVDDWTPFTTNDLPSASLTAVNSLMQQFTTKQTRRAIAVSKFVLMTAYEKCDTDVIEAVVTIATITENPSLQGWAFELKELSKIKTVLRSIEERPRHLRTDQNLVLSPKMECTYDGQLLSIPSDLSGLVVIWCLKWNQGCFDVAFYDEDFGTLVTLQFTIAESHSLKLEYVSQLRAALLWNGLTVQRVVHWFIVNDTAFDDFKHKTPTGTGRRTCRLLFSVRVCRSKRFASAECDAENCLYADGVDVEIHSNKRSEPSLKSD